MLHILQRLMHKMQHIGKRELRVLRYFYRQPTGHVRRIQKTLKMPEHTLLKGLAVLEKKKMIQSRREGNLKIYDVDLKHPLVAVFFAYFDLERLATLEYTREKSVRMFVELVKTIKMPYFVLLFGSTAKGNYAHKSDIDVIVVYGAVEQGIAEKIKGATRTIFAETGLKINSIVMKLGEFLKEKGNTQNYAIQDALASGYPVSGQQFYHEVTST